MRNITANHRLQGNLSKVLLLVGLLVFILRTILLPAKPIVLEPYSSVLPLSLFNSYSFVFHLIILSIVFLFLFQIRKGIETDRPLSLGWYWIIFPIFLWQNNAILALIPILAFLLLQVINKLKRINENEKDLTQSFIIGVFCSLSFFIEPSSIWILPASITGFFIVRSVHFKSLLAIFTGLFTGALYIALALFFLEIKPDFESIVTMMSPHQFGIPPLISERPIYFCAWGGLSLLIIFGGLNHLSEKKIKLRTYYLLFITFFAFALPALFYFSNGNHSIWILASLFLCLTPFYWLILENTKSLFSTLFFLLSPILIEISDSILNYYSLF